MLGERLVNQVSDLDALEAQSSGSSFYAAMKLMPKAERRAMFAIYAFCRQVDDIADDGVGSREDRAAALDALRADIEALYDGRPAGKAAFLCGPVKQFGMAKADFLAVIDGMAMDVAADIRAPDLATFDLYCDRVASAVGRLSVKAFGMEEQPGLQLAHHLGRALQQTNILRDVDEDAGIGRLYMPRELLEAAGVTTDDPALAIADLKLDGACRALAKMAHEHYAFADKVMKAKPKGRLMAPKLMGAVYGTILSEMETAGWAPPRRRVKLSKPRLLLILLRCGLGL